MNDSNHKICVGAIAGGFGVRGEVRIKSFTTVPTDIKKYKPIVDEKGNLFTMTSLRVITDGFAARFEEIDSKEAADALRGTKLMASRAAFPELAEDEYYHSDLVGLDVVDGNGTNIGRVKSLQDFGAGDLLEVTSANKSVLIPFTRAIVPTVDMTARKIIVDPPEGLLDE